jgi:hypothetical protein
MILELRAGVESITEKAGEFIFARAKARSPQPRKLIAPGR